MRISHAITKNMILFFACNSCLLFGESESFNTNSISEAEYSIFLNILASSIKENYDKIETWQGELKFSDTTNYFDAAASHVYKDASGSETASTGRLTKRRNGQVSFAVDVKQNKLFSKILCDKPMQYNVPGETPFSKEKATVWNEACVVTSDHYLHFNPLLNYGQSNTLVSDGARGRVAFKEPPEESKGRNMANVIDPRSTFEYGIPIWKELDLINSHLSSEGTIEIDGHKLTIEQNDNNIVVSLPGKAGESLYLYKKMVFDLNKGSNITSLEIIHGHDNKVRQRVLWDYENVDGTWVPKEMKRQVYNPKLNELKFERAYSFEVNKLNAPIEGDVFTYKNLGLKDGDRLIDSINGIEYTYSKDELVQANNKIIMDEIIMDEITEDAYKNPVIGQENATDSIGIRNPEVILIPSEELALRKEIPYILNLGSRQLFYLKNGIDTQNSSRFLLQKDISGVSYSNGKLIATGKKSYMYKNVAGFEKQAKVNFKKQYSYLDISAIKRFPKDFFIHAHNGRLYRLRILGIEADKLKISYDEIKEKKSRFQPAPLMQEYFTLNIIDDMNQEDDIISRLSQRGKSAIPVFIMSLSSERKGIRLLSAEALGKMAEIDAEAIQALIKAFEHGNNNEAGLSLGRLGEKSKEAVPSLINILQNSKYDADEKRPIAIQSLGRIGSFSKKSVSVLQEIADSNDSVKAKIMAIGALAKIGHNREQNVSILKEMLESGEFKRFTFIINRELKELDENKIASGIGGV